MAKETFIVIHTSEDGETTMNRLSRETLQERLSKTPPYYGECPIFDRPPSQYMQSQVGLWIIKGDLVVPRAVTKVTEFQLP